MMLFLLLTLPVIQSLIHHSINSIIFISEMAGKRQATQRSV